MIFQCLIKVSDVLLKEMMSEKCPFVLISRGTKFDARSISQTPVYWRTFVDIVSR